MIRSATSPQYSLFYNDQPQFVPDSFQPLPTSLLDEIGIDTPFPKPLIVPPTPEVVPLPKSRSHTFTIELPKSRTQKSRSIHQQSYIISCAFGNIKISIPTPRSLVPGDCVILQDENVLRYGVVIPSVGNVHTIKLDEPHSFLNSQMPYVSYVDENRVLVQSLIDRDKKALVLTNLILDQIGASDVEIVFIETVSWNHRAAFYVGHRSKNTSALMEMTKRLSFLFGCQTFLFYIE